MSSEETWGEGEQESGCTCRRAPLSESDSHPLGWEAEERKEGRYICGVEERGEEGRTGEEWGGENRTEQDRREHERRGKQERRDTAALQFRGECRSRREQPPALLKALLLILPFNTQHKPHNTAIITAAPLELVIRCK